MFCRKPSHILPQPSGSSTLLRRLLPHDTDIINNGTGSGQEVFTKGWPELPYGTTVWDLLGLWGILGF